MTYIFGGLLLLAGFLIISEAGLPVFGVVIGLAGIVIILVKVFVDIEDAKTNPRDWYSKKTTSMFP